MTTDSNHKHSWMMLAAIAAALGLWGLLLALGGYLAPSGRLPGHDPRKLWMISATTAGFLALWGVALWMARRRMRRLRDLERKDRPGNSSTGGDDSSAA